MFTTPSTPTRAERAHPNARVAAAISLCVLTVGLGSLLPIDARAAQGGWHATTGSTVYAVAASADGGLVVAGRRDNTVSAYDASGKHLWDFATRGTVYDVAVSADGKRVAIASEDRNVYLLDGGGKELWHQRGQQTFTSVAITTDGRIVVAGSEDRRVSAFNASGTPLWQVTADDDVTAVAIYGSERAFRVVAGSKDSRVTLLNGKGARLWQQTLDRAIRSLDVTSNGARVVVGDDDGTVTMLDGATGKLVWKTATGSRVSASLGRDNKLVVAGNRDGDVVIFQADGKISQEQATGKAIYDLAIVRQTDRALLAGDDGMSAVRQGSNGRLDIEQPRSRVVPIAIAVVAALAMIAVLLGLRRRPSGERVWRSSVSRHRRLGTEIWRSRVSYLFLVPTLALLLVFNYYPAISGIVHAFTVWTPGIETRWVGLRQFRSLAEDRYFAVGVRNLIILILAGFAKLAIPLLVAELIFHLWSHRLRYVFRTLFVLQVIVPGVVGILLWVNIYDPTIGAANQTLRALGLDHWARVWLGDSGTAIWAIVFMGFPWVSAFALLIFYGGLISIPGELFDAAQLDGASAVRRFFNLDLPLLIGQVRLLLILTFIAHVQEFAAIFLTTGGGPGSATYVPSLELYYQAVRFNNFGLASAIGAVLFIVILGGTILNLRYVKSSVEYST